MSKSVEWAIGIRDLVIGVLIAALGVMFMVTAVLEGGNITGVISVWLFVALAIVGSLYTTIGLDNVLDDLLKVKS